MARPAMSAKTTSKHLTSAEKEAKLGTEEKLKGGADKLKPPKYLTPEQRKIFRYILDNLRGSDILGNLDIYVLTECSIALDRMQDIEETINNNSNALFNKDLSAAKERYSKIFFRCCNELCLSPQARAKMGNLYLQAKEENPLIKALMSDD